MILYPIQFNSNYSFQTALQLLKKVNFQLVLLMTSKSFTSARSLWENMPDVSAIRSSLEHLPSVVLRTARQLQMKLKCTLFDYWMIKHLSSYQPMHLIHMNVAVPLLAVHSPMITMFIIVWELHMCCPRKMSLPR